MKQIILGTCDTVVESPAIHGLAQLLLEPRPNEDDTRPILLGCSSAPELHPTRVSLRQLRHLVLRVAAAMEARGIRPGDTVALIRLPRTSETLTAVVYLALSAFGARVLFPMYVVLSELEAWLRESSARLVLASFTEVEELVAREPDVATSRAVREAAVRFEVPLVCIYRDLGLVGALEDAPEASPVLDAPAVIEELAERHGLLSGMVDAKAGFHA